MINFSSQIMMKIVNSSLFQFVQTYVHCYFSGNYTLYLGLYVYYKTNFITIKKREKKKNKYKKMY